jgi:hypothetical protein
MKGLHQQLYLIDYYFDNAYRSYFLLQRFQSNPNVDAKYDLLLHSKSKANDHTSNKNYQTEVLYQSSVFLTLFVAQIPIFLGAMFLPWFQFVKDQITYTKVIDGGALHLNENYSFALLFLGTILSLNMAIRIYENPFLQRSTIRKAYVLLFLILVPVMVSFMVPVFAPGFGGKEEAIGLNSLSFNEYTIYPHIGYLFIVGSIFIAVGGFILSYYWNP